MRAGQVVTTLELAKVYVKLDQASRPCHAYDRGCVTLEARGSLIPQRMCTCGHQRRTRVRACCCYVCVCAINAVFPVGETSLLLGVARVYACTRRGALQCERGGYPLLPQLRYDG